MLTASSPATGSGHLPLSNIDKACTWKFSLKVTVPDFLRRWRFGLLSAFTIGDNASCLPLARKLPS